MIVPEKLQTALWVDTFQVVQDGGDEFLLEFSQQETVVGRVRIHGDVLGVVARRVGSSVKAQEALLYSVPLKRRKADGN